LGPFHFVRGSIYSRGRDGQNVLGGIARDVEHSDLIRGVNIGLKAQNLLALVLSYAFKNKFFRKICSVSLYNKT
jgi:hypothetical protein